MAEVSEKNLGYKTRILGTIKSITECLEIVVYNKYEFPVSTYPEYKKISLYNLQSDLEVVNRGHCLHITRENVDSPFEFRYINPKVNSGFNTIIYLDSLGNAVGYTEFSNTQGQGRDINIFPKQKSVVEDIEVSLVNSLSSLINGTATYSKSFIGEDSKDYTSKKKAIKELKADKEVYYTDHLANSYHNELGIRLDSGLVVGKDMWKMGLEYGMEFNPFGYDFENFEFSYYGDEVIMYAWKGLNYCAVSMTEHNYFGNPIIYTKSGTGYYTLQAGKDESLEILYTSGRYIVCEATNLINNKTYLRLFNIETLSFVPLESAYFVLDAYDSRGRIREIPAVLGVSDIANYIPEVNNTFLDFSDFATLQVKRIFGSWLLIKRRIKSKQVYILSGLSNVVYLSESELDKFMVVDDNTICLDSGDSYIFYGGFGKTYYTEGARKDLGRGGREEGRVIYKDTDLLTSSLFHYRHGPYPLGITGIPNLIGALSGYLFYKDGNRIKYL